MHRLWNLSWVSQSESESRSVLSDSLWPHGLYSPWNPPGQDTGVGSLSLLQGTFPTQGSNPGLPQCRQILYPLSHQGSPRLTPFSLEWRSISLSLICGGLCSGDRGPSFILRWASSCPHRGPPSGPPKLWLGKPSHSGGVFGPWDGSFTLDTFLITCISPSTALGVRRETSSSWWSRAAVPNLLALGFVKMVFPWTGVGVMVFGWLKHITFVVYFTSIIITSTPPQITGH